MPGPKISVIIPAFNSERTIAQTIKAVLDQDHPDPLEVIVVDDGSRDRTPEVVRSFDRVGYISQENAGPAAARNKGAQATKGEILFFTDSDCVPERAWVSKMLPHFEDLKIAVVSGSYGIINQGDLLASCIHKEITFRHTYLMPKTPKSFGSYNFCIRRSVFFEVGGFDVGYKKASGEDNDLSYKIINKNHNIYFEKDSVVSHYHTNNIYRYLNEQFQHGFWRIKIYLDHPRMAKGDDYTFWKDILEIPLAFLSLLVVFGRIPALKMIGQFCIFSSLLIEIFYGFRMIHGFLPSLFFASVMFLRSFARAFGFLSGFFSIPFQNRFKKSK